MSAFDVGGPNAESLRNDSEENKATEAAQLSGSRKKDSTSIEDDEEEKKDDSFGTGYRPF